MKLLKIHLVTALTIVFLGCASSGKMNPSEQAEQERLRAEKAYDYYLEGAMLDFQDQYEKALIQYYQALLYDSSSAQINKAIARNLMRLQNYESAIIHLKKSYALNPKDKETLNYLAEAYYNVKKYRQSIIYYNKQK